MIRLTGGEFNGRAVETPQHFKTRPTQARLRQALFNSLQAFVPDARILDLFSGSGALAFEAISRGAALAVTVEQDVKTAQLISKNAGQLGVPDRVVVETMAVAKFLEGFLKSGQPPFDVILADPPYSAGFELGLLESAPWRELLREDGRFCLEWSPLKGKLAELPDRAPFLVKIREKNYGDSVLTTYQRIE